jgi:hypothetical protein
VKAKNKKDALRKLDAGFPDDSLLSEDENESDYETDREDMDIREI